MSLEIEKSEVDDTEIITMDELDATKDSTPKSLEQVLPHFTCMSVPFDPVTKQVALMWRGNNVRSAKNCVSTPSGLLEHSEPFEVCLIRELWEELCLPPNACKIHRFHNIYRNITGDGLDWVIGVWSVAVDNLENRIFNIEPDKHPALILTGLDDLATRSVKASSVKWIGKNPCGKIRFQFANGLEDVLQSIAIELSAHSI